MVAQTAPPTDQQDSQAVRAEGGRWRAPFAVVTAIGLAAAFLPGGALAGRYVAWCLGTLGAATVLLVGPLLFVRLKARPMVVAGALSYIAFVVLVVQAQGGMPRSGSFQLALLPTIWVSLYSRRFEAGLVVVATVAALVLVSVLGHENADVVERKAGLWLLITTGIVFAIYSLRAGFARAMAERDQTVAHTAALSAALEELTALRHPGAVLETGCRLAAQLTPEGDEGARATYFAVADGTATIVSQYGEPGWRVGAKFLLDDEPLLKEVVSALRPLAADLCPAVGFGAFVPVLYAGRVQGVLSVASRAGPISAGSLAVLVSVARVVGLALANAMAHDELERLAHRDPLTGAVNRRGLEAVVAPADGYVVVAADLDGLKDINDTYGHAVGDLALARFADLLRSVARPDDAVARIGGDEFNIVLTGAPVEAGRAVAKRVLLALGAEVDQPLLRASLGMAVATGDDTYYQVAHRADEAMYNAKRAGGMTWAEEGYRQTDNRAVGLQAVGSPAVLRRGTWHDSDIDFDVDIDLVS
jgi:diguanylate cyclase (GGDEF)-like protein